MARGTAQWVIYGTSSYVTGSLDRCANWCHSYWRGSDRGWSSGLDVENVEICTTIIDGPLAIMWQECSNTRFRRRLNEPCATHEREVDAY